MIGENIEIHGMFTFISIPFIGGMLGSIVYLIILGGLFALSSGNTATVNPLAIIPFAALAGYNWEWAITIFNKIGEVLTERKPEAKNEISHLIGKQTNPVERRSHVLKYDYLVIAMGNETNFFDMKRENAKVRFVEESTPKPIHF